MREATEKGHKSQSKGIWYKEDNLKLKIMIKVEVYLSIGSKLDGFSS